MQITVLTHGGPMMNASVRDQVQVRGLESIEPTIPVNNITLGALAMGVDRVEIIGPTLTGALTRVDDFIRLEMVANKPSAIRYIIYEFSGWQER